MIRLLIDYVAYFSIFFNREQVLSSKYQIKLSRYKARKIMQEQGLVSRQRTKHRYKQADKPHRLYDNVLNRNFAPTASNQVWTGDVTYIRTQAVLLSSGGYRFVLPQYRRICDERQS